MIEEFLHWWAQQLLAWLPRRLRSARGPADGVTARLLTDGELEIGRRRAGSITTIDRFATGSGGAALRGALGPRPGSVALLLPPGAMLRRSVELPLAAERNLGQVLRYEMDRLTPFAAGEVDWNWSVQGRDKARDRVRLALLLAPKAFSNTAIEALRAAGATVGVLESSLGAIPLDPALQGGGRWRGQLVKAGALLCGLLALVAAGLPFAIQSAEMDRVERSIRASRPAVDKAEALRRQIASGTLGADVLAAQREATGEVLSVVALVTDILPDDTYLTELGWRARTLTLTGQSAAAARLIGALSQEPTVRNPTFAAPVTRDELAKLDRFSIRADVAP